MQTKLKEIKNNEEGAALIFVMMILLVFVAIGGAVGTVTVGSHRLSENNKDYNSAYYIAEAGANMAYAEIEAYVLEAYKNSESKSLFFDKVSFPLGHENNLKSKEYNDFIGGSRDNTKANVSITPGPENGNTKEFTITSVGEVSGKKRTVEKKIKVNWFLKGGNGGTGNIPKMPQQAALVAKSELKILNGSITGSAYITSVRENSIKLKGSQGGEKYSIYYPSGVSYESILDNSEIDRAIPSFIQRDTDINWEAYDKLLDIKADFIMPSQTQRLIPYEYIHTEDNKYWLIDRNGSIHLNNWMIAQHTLDVTTDLYIPNINIGSAKELILNVGNGDYKIYVDSLKVMSGNLDVKGPGNVTIIVRESTSFNHESFINKSGASNQLTLVYTGSTPNFSEITSMNGNIISLGNGKNIAISNSSINGVFLTDAKKVNFTGGNIPSNMMMIAPKAEIVLGSGYKINGTLIGDKIKTDGDGTINFTEIDTSKFLYGSGTDKLDPPSRNELISHDLVIEQ